MEIVKARPSRGERVPQGPKRERLRREGAPGAAVLLLLLLLGCTTFAWEPADPEPLPPEERVCGELYQAMNSLQQLRERPEAWALADLIGDYTAEWCYDPGAG